MSKWTTALRVVAMMCLPLVCGVCRTQRTTDSSLAHYRLGESFLQEDNLQSAANEFRQALNGNQDEPWTAAWSHIKLAIIFDASGQHDRAVNEYRQAQRTGDNTTGALDEANNYLQHGDAIYLGPPSHPAETGTPAEPIHRSDPEYTEEARIAELEGTVVLGAVINENGLPQDLHVITPLGLGLDEKAVEAASQWQFQPKLTPAYKIQAVISVRFKLPTKHSSWHLIRVKFETPSGASRPLFTKALYPIGAGLGPDAMEEGSVLAAIGRFATAELTFDVDEHGVPKHFRRPNASAEVWGSEATALVGEWRFTPATENGIPVPSACTIDLVWGAQDSAIDLEGQLHDVLTPR